MQRAENKRNTYVMVLAGLVDVHICNYYTYNNAVCPLYLVEN